MGSYGVAFTHWYDVKCLELSVGDRNYDSCSQERIGYVDVLTTDGTVKLSFFDRPPVAETMKLPRGLFLEGLVSAL